MIKQMLIDLLQSVNNNRGKFLGSFLGFLIAILVLTIGFFKTLFIVICTSLGYVLGSKSDNKINLKELLERILPPGRIN
ncbi:DUF2273 domain-containing protein [Tissierella simiarum]